LELTIRINVLSYYFPYILNTVLQKSQHYSAVLGGLNALVYVLCIIPSVFFVDLVGRKVLLIVGSAGQSACFAVMTGMLYMVLNSPNAESYGEGAIAMVFIFGAYTFHLFGTDV
jgi:Sugar (and other) transporter